MNKVSANGISTVSEGGPQSQRYSAISTSLLLSLLLGVGLLAAFLGVAHSMSAHSVTSLKDQKTPLLPTHEVPSLTATSTCGPDWTVVSNPNTGFDNNSLNGVAAVSSSDVWAVGSYAELQSTLVEHWNGSVWTVVPSPDVDSTSDDSLNGVAVVSSSDVWAVGSYRDDNEIPVFHTLTEHWDGTSWRIVPSRDSSSGDSLLNGVAVVSSSDVWAVGYVSGTPSRTLVEHWNGATWDIVSSSNPGTSENILEGVAAVSSSNAWAVGYQANGTTYRTLVERWDGSSWHVITSPDVGTTENKLLAVSAVSTGDVWAAGYYDNSFADPHQTLTEHWNGSAWQVVTSPNMGLFPSTLDGVAAVSSSDVWAVGYYSTVSSPYHYQTLTEHWNGMAWSVVSSPNAADDTNYLFGIAQVSHGDVWAVGSYDDSSNYIREPLIERYNPCTTSCSLQFEDVPNPSTFYAYVQCLACKGIINGYPCGSADEPCNPSHDPYFRPNADVSRGQIAKIVALSAAINAPVSSQTFEDVLPGSAFFTYTEQLYALRVMNGYPCGSPGDPCNPPNNRPYFRPNAETTRGQLAKIVSNAAGYNNPPSGQSFEDIAAGSTFYTYTQRLTSRGVMSGYACGGVGEPCEPPANLPYFRPNANVTRGQSTKIVGNTFFPNCR